MLKKIAYSIRNKKRIFFIMTFFMIVVGITLGSSFLSKTLTIGGKTKIQNNWIIYFDKVVLNENSVKNDDASKDAKIVDFEKQNIEFSANLSNVDDFYEFYVYTVNDGDIDAMIDSIEKSGLSDEQSEYVSFDVVYDDENISTSDKYYSSKYSYSNVELQRCDPLFAETRRKIKVTVKLKKKLDTIDSLNLNLGFKINYVQYDSGCVISMNKLTIDPNGGTYNEKKAQTKIFLESNESTSISVPTKGDVKFVGWEVLEPTSGGTYTFNPELTSEQTFVMGDEDVTIRAIWDDTIEEDYVARIMDTYYTTIQKAFDEVDFGWSDNTVYLLKDTTEYPTNNAKNAFTFNLGAHTVTGMITNSKDSNITLVNGRIESDTNDTQAFTNNGVLTLGINDGEVEVENSIALVGNKVGLISNDNAKFNFYDGYIDAIIPVGEKGAAYIANSDIDTPKDYSVAVDHLDNGQRAYVTKDPSRAVAKTLTNGAVYYYNLQDAINSVSQIKSETNYTIDTKVSEDENGHKSNCPDAKYIIYAIRDFDATYSLDVSENSDVCFDISGYEIRTGETITNNGNFYIDNSKQYSSTDDMPIIKVSKKITNNGNLNIQDVVITATTDINTILNNKNLVISNSIINSKTDYSVYNSTDATIKLNENAVLKAEDTYSIYNESDKLVLDNGIINGLYNVSENGIKITGNAMLLASKRVNPTFFESYIYAIRNSGTITMDGGTVTSDENATLIDNQSGTMNVNAGNITAKKAPAITNGYGMWGGTLNIKGGDISSTSTTIYNGTVHVNGGKVHSSDASAINGSALYVYDGEVYSDNDDGIYGGGPDIYIYGGEVRGKEYAIYSYSSSDIYIEGGTISSDKIAIYSSNYSSYGSYVPTVFISGGTITGKNIGVQSYKNIQMTDGEVNSGSLTDDSLTGVGIFIGDIGTAVITGGTVKGGLYAVQNTGTLVLGVDDYDENNKALVDITTPVLIGKQYGVYIDNATTNFYDGILKGTIDGYYGEITGNPLGALIVEGEETIYGKEYNTDFVSNYASWLRVNGVEYNSINEASAAIESEGTIEVIADATLSFGQTFMNNEDNNKKITFDLNGHKITSSQSIINEVDLTIIDSSTEQTGTYNPITNTGLINNNVLTLNGGIYESDLDKPIQNNKAMIVDKATFNVEENAISNGESGYSSASLTINDINITKATTGILNNGSVTMNGGEINATNRGIYNSTLAGLVTIKDGKITAGKMAIGGSYGSVIVDGGEIISTSTNCTDRDNCSTLYSYDGSITVNGGTITSENNIAVLSSGNITINGGVISGTVGVQNEKWCNWSGSSCTYYNIYITAADITGTSTDGIHANGGELYINSGIIRGKTNGVYTAAETQIGEDDGNISTSDPILMGEDYGLYTTSYTKFYDGILKGIKDAHTGLISLIPDGTMIKDDKELINEVQYKTQYLTEYGNWLRVGDQEFNSINEAAKAINGTGTMVVIANPYIGFEQTMPSGKNITFDLNGHSLIMTQPIIINGTATFIDSSATAEDAIGGSINNLRDSCLINNGTLTIKKGIYSSETNYTINNTGTFILDNGSLMSKDNYAVENTGTFTMNDGTINTYGGVNNKKAGQFTMNDGYIEGKSLHSIYTEGTTTINDGIIKRTNYDANLRYSIQSAIKIYDGLTTINGGDISSNIDIAIEVYNSTAAQNPSLVVNSGEIYGSTNGIYNSNYSTYRSSTIINGGTISSEQYGVYNNSGTTLVIGGTIDGKVHGIYSKGTLTLGENDENISSTSPVIKGDTYAVYNDGISFNFYDGILKGNTTGDTDAYYGDLTTIPSGSELMFDEETPYNTTMWLIPERDIAINLNTNKVYSNLQLALDEASSGETVQLIYDSENSKNNTISLFYELTNTNTNEFTLDLNGFKIITNKKIINNGNLTIKNSNSNEAIIQTKTNIELITNNNILNLDNININVDSSRAMSAVFSTGTLSITNSNISSLGCAFSIEGKTTIDNSVMNGYSCISYSNNKEVNITNSTLNGYVSSYNRNVTNIKNSTINAPNDRIDNSHGTLNITDSTLNTSITNSSGGKIYLKNVAINSNTRGSVSNYAIENSSGIFDIENSYINVLENYVSYSDFTITAIINRSQLDMRFSDINIGYEQTNSDYNNKTYVGINSSGGTTTVLDSNIKVTGGVAGYGIKFDSDSTLEMKSGRIEVNKTREGYGAYVRYGTFILGVDDDDSQGNNVFSSLEYDDPTIYVSAYRNGIGVKKINGTFNFHDGIVWGSSKAIPESVSKTPTYHEVTTYLDNKSGLEYAVLENVKNDYKGTAVALLNNIYYLTLQDAINMSSPGDEIKLLQSITEDVVVTKNKDVVINLNGKSITTTVTNSGKLRVYNGLLQSIDVPTIVNTGTFIMGTNDGNVSPTSVIVASETTTIVNKGTLIMYDGYIEGKTPVDGQINEIADLSRIYTFEDEQKIRKYLQSLSEESIKNGDTDLVLTIDPKGGYYEDSKDIKTIYLKYNSTYTLSTPTKPLATFDGWESNIEGTLDENIVTMNKTSDVTISAKWKPNDNVVAKIGDDYYTSLSEAINKAENLDTIELLKDTTENVTNTKNITIDLGNKKVTGTFINNGILTLLNGTIENTNGTGLVNNNTLTLGENDAEVSIDSLKIIGKEIGLKQNGTLNFYDGYIEGNVALDGNTSSLPQGYYLSMTINGENRRVYLSESNSNAVAAINNGGIMYFEDLNSAIAVAQAANKEIYIVKSFESSDEITIDEGTNVVINLNSYNVILSKELTNSGTLKLYDSSENTGSINITNTINNKGSLDIQNIDINQMTDNNLILNDGILTVSNSNLTARNGYGIYNNGSLEVNKGTSVISNKYSIYNNSSDTLTINTGKFTSIENVKSLVLGSDVVINNTNNGIACINSSTDSSSLTINGGTYTSTGVGINLLANNQSFEMNDGSITSSSYGVYTTGISNEITITGGDITSTSSNGIHDAKTVSDNKTTTTITGGTITGATDGINLEGNNFTMTGGKVVSTSTDTSNYALQCKIYTVCEIKDNAQIYSDKASGIYIRENLTLNGAQIYSGAISGYGVYIGSSATINGDTIVNTPGSSSIGIFVNSNDVTINNVEVNSGNIGINIPNYSSKLNLNGGSIVGQTYGIRQTNANSTLNIGSSSSDLSTDNPYVSGGLYGIYKIEGTTNFYNGVLRGSVYGYSGSFNNLRESKEVTEVSQDIDISDMVTYNTTNVSEIPVSEYAKSGNGHAKITYLGDTTETCETGKTYEYNYKGVEVRLTIPCTGKYKLEVWGAQGGGRDTYSATQRGGYGGYSTGEVTLAKGEVLYINVGGEGTSTPLTANSVVQGGYNGGGDAINSSVDGSYSGSGGGATSIATSSGLLQYLENNKDSILIVAGGGGGYYYGKNYSDRTTIIGHGGGATGTTAIGGIYYAEGGSQTRGYSFGQAELTENIETPGAGGGYYSGYTDKFVAGGGSGYIGNSNLENAYMYGYNSNAISSSYTSNYLIEKGNFLQVGNETFNSINKAVAAIADEGTITVINDAEILESSQIDSSKNITLDLNGHTLTMTEPITNNGTLSIIDSTNSNSKIQNTLKNAIDNNGDLTLQNVTIKSVAYGIYVNTANHNIKLDNATIETTNNSIYITSSNAYSNTITIKNSTITSTSGSAIYDDCSSSQKNTINISNSELEGYKYGIYGKYISQTISNSKIKLTASSSNFVIYLSNSDITIKENSEISTDVANGIYISYTKLDFSDSKITTTARDKDSLKVTDSSTATIYGNSNIEATGELSYAINFTNGTIHLNEGIISSKCIGIGFGTDTSTRTLNINGGSIIAEKYGIYLRGSNSTVNVGSNDKSLSIEEPYISGDQYAIYKEAGKSNFYNGKLRGKEYGYYGDFYLVRTGMKIYETFEFDTPGDMSTKYIVNYLGEQEGYLKVGSQTYNTFDKAIAALGDSKSGTITVISDISIQDSVSIDGNDIVLDLNGHKLTMSDTMTNNSNLTIIDSKTNGKIKSNASSAITNNGDLTINSGIIESSGNGIYTNTSSHSLTINGGIINTQSYAIFFDAKNAYDNTLTITSGEITSTGSYAIYDSCTNTTYRNKIYISGGTITGATNGVNLNAVTGEINGGAITTTSTSTSDYALILSNPSNMSITTGSTISAPYAGGIRTTDGTLTINGAKIETYAENAISLYNVSTNITIKGDTIINARNIGIYNNSTTTINNGSITSDNVGILAYSGILNLYGGTITGNTYGISESSGNVNIGNSNKELSTSNPHVIGGTYAVYKYGGGGLNFYSGKLQGVAGTSYTVFTSIRSGEYFAYEEKVDDYYISYLKELENGIRNKTTGTEYKYIKQAITEANSGDTLELINDVNNYEEITINSGTNITIDLNGYNFSTSKAITNKGELTITNSGDNKDAKFYSDISITLITNSNVLNIKDVNLSGSTIIDNSKEVYIDNSNLESSNIAIKNSNTITIDSSDISGSSYAIYDTSSIDNKIKDSVLSSDKMALYLSTINTNGTTITDTDISGTISISKSATKLLITGGNIKDSYITSSGTLIISKAAIDYESKTSSNEQIIKNDGTLELANDKISYNTKYDSNNNSYVVYNTGTLTSKDNTYDMKYTNIGTKYRYFRGIYNNSILSSTNDTFNIKDSKEGYSIYNNSGTATIENIDANVIDNTTSYGIYINSGNVTLKDGSIKSSGETSYGVYVYGTSAIFTLGENDERETTSADVSITNPYIEAIGTKTGYGISSKGIFNFYDGHITGSTAPKDTNVVISSKQKYYNDVIKYNDSTGYYYCILEISE